MSKSVINKKQLNSKTPKSISTVLEKEKIKNASKVSKEKISVTLNKRGSKTLDENELPETASSSATASITPAVIGEKTIKITIEKLVYKENGYPNQLTIQVEDSKKFEYQSPVLTLNSLETVLNNQFDFPCFPSSSTWLDDVTANPLLFTLFEVPTNSQSLLLEQNESKPKQKKRGKKSITTDIESSQSVSEEFDKIIIGSCNLDLLPLLLGEVEIRESLMIYPHITLEEAEIQSWVQYPELSVCAAIDEPPLITAEEIEESNVLFITLESIYNLHPAICNGMAFTAATVLPFNLKHLRGIRFEKSFLRHTGTLDNKKRWIGYADVPGLGSYSKYSLDDALPIKTNLKVDLEKSMNESVGRIEWNALRRTWLTKSDTESLLGYISKYRSWPLEIIMEDRYEIDSEFSDLFANFAGYIHLAAHFDVSALLYPGVTKAHVVSQVYTYCEEDMQEKCGIVNMFLGAKNELSLYNKGFRGMGEEREEEEKGGEEEELPVSEEMSKLSGSTKSSLLSKQSDKSLKANSKKLSREEVKKESSNKIRQVKLADKETTYKSAEKTVSKTLSKKRTAEKSSKTKEAPKNGKKTSETQIIEKLPVKEVAPKNNGKAKGKKSIEKQTAEKFDEVINRKQKLSTSKSNTQKSKESETNIAKRNPTKNNSSDNQQRDDESGDEDNGDDREEEEEEKEEEAIVEEGEELKEDIVEEEAEEDNGGDEDNFDDEDDEGEDDYSTFEEDACESEGSSYALIGAKNHPVFIVLEIALLKPLRPKISHDDVMANVDSIIPKTKLNLPKHVMTAQLAESHFQECIQLLSNKILLEYQSFWVTHNNLDKDVSGKDQRDDRHEFYEHLVKNGFYQLMKETLRNKITLLMKEKSPKSLQLTKRGDIQTFLSETYVYVVEQVNRVLNNIFEASVNDQFSCCLTNEELYFFAKVAVVQRRHNTAAKFHEDLINRDKECVDWWLEYAVFWMGLSRWDNAILCVLETLSLDRRNKLGLLLYALLMSETGEDETAHTFFCALTTLYPRCREGWMIFHVFHKRSESFDKAAAAIQNAFKYANWDRISAPCIDTEPILWRSNAYDVSGRPLLQTAIFLMKVNALSFANLTLGEEFSNNGLSLGYIYYMSVNHILEGRYDYAATHLKNALVEHYNDMHLWVLLGHSHYGRHDYDVARQHYEFLVDFGCCKPADEHVVCMRLGECYVRCEEYERAKRAFVTSCTYRCTPWNCLGLGIAHYMTMDFVEAENVLEQANYLDNTNPVVWGYLTLVNLQLHRRREFEHCYRQAMRFQLRDQELLQWINALCEHLKYPNLNANPGTINPDPQGSEVPHMDILTDKVQR